MGQETTTTYSEAATVAFAAGLAARLAPGDVVALSGPLGAGKSVFARALIRALAGEPGLVVPSPTYTLLQTYDTPAGSVWHFDLYRLRDPEEVWELGWEEISGAIALVEWPERAGEHLPARRIDVSITCQDGSNRVISISETGPR